jgi:hypothetical protein
MSITKLNIQYSKKNQQMHQYFLYLKTHTKIKLNIVSFEYLKLKQIFIIQNLTNKTLNIWDFAVFIIYFL